MVEAHFDTNIIIDYLKGREPAQVELELYETRYVSVVTWMELMAGPVEQLPHVEALLAANFIVVGLTSEIAKMGARLQRDMRIKLPDAVILATARVNGRVLVSRNTRDFPVGTAGVRVPYRI